MNDANSWRRRLVTDQQEETIICQPVYIHVPVYDERDVSKDTVLVDETQCQDFSVNVNMEISKNQFIRKYLYYDELKTRTTVAVYTLLAILFVWFLTNLKNFSVYDLSDLPNVILILSLYLASAVVGQTLSAVSHIPPFVGMILVGMAFQNSGVIIQIDEFEDSCFWLYLSEFIESVILIIGALELDVWKLHRMGFTVFKLALLQQIAEIVALSAIALNYSCQNSNQIKLTHMFLFNMSSINSILFMPSISVFQRLGYFNENNVYTVLHAASNIVNIVAMIINYITYTKYEYNHYLVDYEMILYSSFPQKIFIDIMFGIIWGIFLIYISPPDFLMVNNDLQQEEVNDHEVNNKQISNLLTTTKRVVLLLTGGILTSIINLYYNTPDYFSLSCGISSFIAGIGWKWKMREINHNTSTISLNNDNTEDQNQIFDILKVLKYILNALQPLFFGFIGTGFHFRNVNVNTILITSLILLVFIRILITAFSVWRSGFNCSKLIFIVITWLQNSTTMAVLAPLYLGIFQDNVECFHFDEELFNVTVIFNIMTATLGTFFVRCYGPKLLSDEINDHIDV